jgi:hypothetical protein
MTRHRVDPSTFSPKLSEQRSVLKKKWKRKLPHHRKTQGTNVPLSRNPHPLPERAVTPAHDEALQKAFPEIFRKPENQTDPLYMSSHAFQIIISTEDLQCDIAGWGVQSTLIRECTISRCPVSGLEASSELWSNPEFFPTEFFSFSFHPSCLMEAFNWNILNWLI